MEFFYFADYWGMSPERRRRARRSRLDVCEQVLYHLVAFKPPMTEADVRDLGAAYYMPPELEERRAAARRRQGWRARLLRRP